jgi:glycosyltransferase involved in cell wall biosynthesis
MKTAAVTMVRDEADIIGYTVKHLFAQGVDFVVVADNLSTDETPLILSQLADEHPNLVTLQDDNPAYVQDEKMTFLAHYAGKELGAEWVLPFDADEYWYWTGGTLAEFFAAAQVDVVTATGWDHIATDEDDPTEPNPFTRIKHRRQSPQKMGKVAFRYHPEIWIDYGNHFLFGHPGTHGKALNYRHFQYRTFEQMATKVRNGKQALDAADLHPQFGTHWRNLGGMSDDDIWQQWRRLCEEPGLIEDAAQ